MELKDWLHEDNDFTDDATRNAFCDWCEETGLIWQAGHGWTGKPISGKSVNATNKIRICKLIRKLYRLRQRNYGLKNYRDAPIP